MANRKVIRPIPTGTSAADKAAASEVKASVYFSAAGQKMHTGRVYELEEGEAAYFVARKGWKYADENGKPTDETADDPHADDVRPGTQASIDEARRLVFGEEATEPEPEPEPEPSKPSFFDRF